MTVGLCRKFFKGSVLDNFTLVYDDDPIALLNGWHSMGDHNGSTAFHRAVQCLLNDFLTLFIQCWCGFIEDQNLGVLDKSSCNGDSLFLSSWKLRSLQSTDLLETWMELFLGLINFLNVDHVIKQFLVLSFDPRATFKADEVLEAVVIIEKATLTT